MKELLYGWNGLNLSLFLTINHLQGETYDRIMLLGSALADRYLFPIYLAILIVMAVLRLRSLRATPDEHRRYAAQWVETILVFAFTFVIGGLLVMWLKDALHFPRPYAELPADMLRPLGASFSEKKAYLSFPSGHAAFASLIAATLWPVLQRSGRLIVCIYVLWVCWSRIALGVHYPADVLGGILLTVPTVILIRRIIRAVLHNINHRTKLPGA